MMKSLYDKIREKQFRLIASILCLLGDLAICRYLYVKMTSKETFATIMKGIKLSVQGQAELQGVAIPQNFHQEMYQLLVQTLMIIFVIIIGFHSINYLMYALKRSYWAHFYIKVMVWPAALGVLFFAFEGFSNSPILAAYLFLQTFFYIFVGLGLNHFKIEQSQGPRSKFSQASPR